MGRIATALVGVALVFGGCGGSSPTTNPLAVIISAADKTKEAGTARVSMDMKMDGPTGAVTMTAEGLFDMASKTGEMTMEMEMPDAPAGTPDLGTTEAVFQGTVIYMKMAALSAQLPPGKPWVSFDLQSVGEEVGLDFEALMQSGTSDPTQTLEYLRGASGEVETVGEEEVRGAPATHYRASISFDKILEQAPPELRDRLKPSIELMKEWAGADQIPVELWIDEEGRLVRMEQAFEYAAGPAAGSSMDMAMEMYDFGIEVDVQVPPPSQVTDLQELMSRAGQAPAAP